eukprot:SM000056S17939  [mRNA]  locus=s56:196309:198415:+ [translate_table: standard]
MAAGHDACAGDCRGERASPGLSAPGGGRRIAVSVSRGAASASAAQGGQLFLDLGQADFSSTTCRACGLLYAPGLLQDEALHASFHRRATGGVPFEGWKQERVVKAAAPGGGRILLIDAQDPFRQRQKAREVLQVVAVELELDFNRLQEAHCKVHDAAQSPGTVSAGAMKGVTMRFGNITFRREVAEKRRHTFLLGCKLPRTHCAFSQPTRDGQAFATKYFGRDDFLVYLNANNTATVEAQ